VRELVLVGGGHSHVQVIRRWAMRPLADARLTVVLDRPVAVYSGMVPGYVAGGYGAHDLGIDVVPLARRAGARVVLAACTGVDPEARTVALEGRPPLRYDVCSLDVGSTVRGLDVPGAREHALSTRPIGRFVAALSQRVEEVRVQRGDAPTRVVVVGAGAGGVELAFALEARLAREGTAREVTLVDSGDAPLRGAAAGLVARVRRAFERRAIGLRLGARVERVEAHALTLAGGGRLPADLVVWATGAAPHAFLLDAGLPVDEHGFVRVDRTLGVQGRPGLFAAGDCASLSAYPWVPKAGVYAVRAGPVLDHNLRAAISGRGRLRAYRPQRDFLTLLNLGDGTAIGGKWGASFEGRWVWRWKDRIDRRFMRRFQVLGPDGVPLVENAALGAMGNTADAPPMLCGGCAAKVGATSLSRALDRLGAPPADPSVLLGLGAPDDAAALALSGGEVLLATVDAFPAFADEPWLTGRVAAVNAVSDVLATGGDPTHALAWVTVPTGHAGGVAGEGDGDGAAAEREEETLYQVLAGVRAALDPIGVTLVGGHSTTGEGLSVGLSVLGRVGSSEAILAKGGARPGDRLILTKPLGTGVVLRADMLGEARGAWVQATVRSMLRHNAAAARIARGCARAVTDISGFGLAGHLAEMARAGGVSLEVWLSALPALPGAIELLGRGLRSTAHDENARVARAMLFPPGGAARSARAALMFDPQTSGGLLLAVPPERTCETLEAIRAAGDAGAVEIGVVDPPRPDGALVVASAVREGSAVGC
jgi:selenide,water dikinase